MAVYNVNLVGGRVASCEVSTTKYVDDLAVVRDLDSGKSFVARCMAGVWSEVPAEIIFDHMLDRSKLLPLVQKIWSDLHFKLATLSGSELKPSWLEEPSKTKKKR